MGKLYDFVISEPNIYNAIYSMESYVVEKYLLSNDDIILYKRLADKYDYTLMEEVIGKCRKRLEILLDKRENLFELHVYFKLKGYDADSGKVKYRPIHTASLIDQICMVCLLNCIMFDDSSGKRSLSELSLLLPHNFYGNLPSIRMEEIFQPWPVNYKYYNEAVESKAKEYQETYEYKTQVCLDLQDFFPSISPEYIFNYIYSRLSSRYTTHHDLMTLKKILSKLLYFKISDEGFDKWEQLYYKKKLEGIEEYFNRGIAQGLPQGMFFGNLAMIAISKIIADVFPGDAYYYVDDSVIFSKEIFTEGTFEAKVVEVNKKLKFYFDNFPCSVSPMVTLKVKKFTGGLEYIPQCHVEGKSFFDMLVQDGKPSYLWKFPFFTREVSISGSFSDNFEDIDDVQSENKLKALLEALEDYIQNFNKDTHDYRSKDSKLKFLKRYRKFFEYQLMIARFKNNECAFDEYSNEFSNDYTVAENNSIQCIFDKLDEGIFRAEYRFLIERFDTEDDKVSQIVRNLEQELAEKDLVDTKGALLYYRKDLKGCIYFKEIQDSPYKTLDKIFRKRSNQLESLKETEKILTYLMSYDCSAVPNELTNLFEKVGMDNCFVFVSNNSDEFWRKIYNVLVSVLFKVDVDDKMVVVKKSAKRMKYFEFRLLSFLRNRRFTIKSYREFLQKLQAGKHATDINDIPVDLNLLHVISLFIRHVQVPSYVDNLVVTHAIVQGLWMNGSKFLYAYTLHNEEHAMELIRQCVRIIRTIDILSIKHEDFYTLFLACYLHDLSMVVQPNRANFVKNTTTTNLLATSCLEEIKLKENTEGLSLTSVKEIMVNAFQAVYSYFEDSVRKKHPVDSAIFIRNRMKEFFSYLDAPLMENVAKVAESHGWETNEVYGRKSFAEKELVSMKYMMILIRLADLLDMSKDRVNYFLLKENMKNLSLTSCFHWITHYITNKVEFTAEYKYEKEKINELISVNIHLNINKQIPCSHKSKKCKDWKSVIKDNRIQNVTVNQAYSGAGCKSCRFICKWMHAKNEWLFSELHELEKYVKLVNVALFSSKIQVNLIMDSNNKLDSELFDKVLDFLEE